MQYFRIPKSSGNNALKATGMFSGPIRLRRLFSLGDDITLTERVTALRRKLQTTPNTASLKLAYNDYRILVEDHKIPADTRWNIWKDLMAYRSAVATRDGITLAQVDAMTAFPSDIVATEPVATTTTTTTTTGATTATYMVLPKYTKTTSYPSWCTTTYQKAVYDSYYKKYANSAVLQVIDPLTGGPTKGSPGPRGFYSSAGIFVPWPSIAATPPETTVTIVTTEAVPGTTDTSSATTPIVVSPQITVEPAAVTVLTSGTTDTTGAASDVTSSVSDFLNQTLTVGGYSIPMKYAIGGGALAAALWYMGSKK